MDTDRNNMRKPAIVVARSDHARLRALADMALERLPEVAEELHAELARARQTPDASLPASTVRMGSTLAYRVAGGEARQVTLVYPEEADISLGRVSILTPIGAALIGLSAGQSIDWRTRDGHIQRLTVETVSPPAPATVKV